MCEQQMQNDPLLTGAAGVSIVGFSQGGLYARALVQTCPGIRFVNLITLGSPHGGVEAIPGCDPDSDPDATAICKATEAFLALGVYSNICQNNVVVAQYFRDPEHEDKFLADKIYLAQLNNLVDAVPAYKDRLSSLSALALFRFTNDTIVTPGQSAHFAYTAAGSGIIPLAEQRLYTEDFLGLRTLNETGRLLMGDIQGAHMQFSLQWFSEHVIRPYLAATPPPATATF